MDEKTKCSLKILRDIFVETVRKLPEDERSGLIVLWDDQWDEIMSSVNAPSTTHRGLELP